MLAGLASDAPRRHQGISQRCPRRESNLDLPLRRRSSYPLDYEGVPGETAPVLRRLPALLARASYRVAPRLPRHALERLPVQTMRDPLAHRARAETPVEAEGRLVPVERRPFQPPPSSF